MIKQKLGLSWWVAPSDEAFVARLRAELPRLVRETYGEPAPMVGDEIVVTNYGRRFGTGWAASSRSVAPNAWREGRFEFGPHAKGARAKGAEQGYIRDLVDFESMGW